MIPSKINTKKNSLMIKTEGSLYLLNDISKAKTQQSRKITEVFASSKPNNSIKKTTSLKVSAT